MGWCCSRSGGLRATRIYEESMRLGKSNSEVRSKLQQEQRRLVRQTAVEEYEVAYSHDRGVLRWA